MTQTLSHTNMERNTDETHMIEVSREYDTQQVTDAAW